MNKAVAVVVTYNRLNILKECIEALLKQKHSCDILIVDNASTDNTEQYVRELENKYSNLHYRNTGSNLGGAGGFNFGMRLAVELGYEYVWMMDDDCIPYENTLEELFKADRMLNGNYGWLSSKVLWKDGNICKMNIQRKTMYKNVKDFKSDFVQIAMASFVSFFIPTKIIKENGLPIKEFFIWTDDWEYTRRISLRHKCYLVNNSIVIHKSNSNIGANIAIDINSRLDRYKYLYRNDVYLYKREGIKGFIYEFIRLSFHILRVFFKAKDKKIKRLLLIINGTISGLKFNPDI